MLPLLLMLPMVGGGCWKWQWAWHWNGRRGESSAFIFLKTVGVAA